MGETVTLTLPSGKDVLIETSGTGGGLRDLSTSGPSKRSLTEVAEEMRETVAVLAGALENLTPRVPDKVGIELSFELATNGVIKLLGADAKGGIKVSLAWEKPKA